MNNHNDGKILFNSLKWTFAEQVFKQVLSFSIGVLLARLLSPKEFGLIAMITVFTGFSSVLINMGLGSAIIQRKEIDREYISTAFWINIAFGVITFVAINLCNPLIVNFYGENILSKLIPFVALNILLSSCSVIPNALMMRRLKFQLLFRINTFAILVSGIGAIVIAYLDYSVWSLIVQSLLLQFTTVLLLWIFSTFRPTFTFSIPKMRNLFNFSLPLLGYSSVTYLYRNIDSVLIGKNLGSDILGLYNKSYALMSLPLSNINNAIGKAVFPSFAKMQDNKKLVKNIFFQAISAISLLAFPVMTIIAILAHPIIDFIYGTKWIESAPILSVLAIAGMVQAISSLNGNVYLAFGKTKLLFKVGFMTNLFFILTVFFTLQWGVMGVTLGVLFASILILPINWYFINKILLSNWKNYFNALFKVSIITIINSLILNTTFYQIIKLGSFWQIIIIGSLGLFLYISAYEFFKIEAYFRLKDLLKSKFL